MKKPHLVAVYADTVGRAAKDGLANEGLYFTIWQYILPFEPGNFITAWML